MRERGGRTILGTIDEADAFTIRPAIVAHVEAGATIHTDEAPVYKNILPASHTKPSIICVGEYVRDDVSTNNMESVFAVLKRGLVGVYHHASPKHLERYVDEFAFRLNEGNVKNR